MLIKRIFFRKMSDCQGDTSETERPPKLSWTAITTEGNKFCQSLNKMIKTNPNDGNFKSDFIMATNELLDKVFDVINNKVPGLGEFLELKNLEHFHRPDWSRALLTNDEIRLPVRPRDHIKDQLTDMETKLQLILARIPNTDDFIKELKIQFKNGSMGSEDEFVRVQNGLLGVTRRVDEIEDFRETWKKHKDTILSIIKRKNVPFNVRPVDISNMKFFQFINHPIGHSCYMLITLNGWPTTEEWKQWEAWWNIQLQRVADHENHRGSKSSSSTWHMQVAHTAAMIMQAIQDINIAAASNIASIQLEPLIWQMAFIQNALTEIFIIPKANEKSWFANLWEINKKLSSKTPTVDEMSKMLTTIVPARISETHILHVSTPRKDLIPIKDHKYEMAISPLPVPRIRSIDENYRVKLDSSHRQTPEASEPKTVKRKTKKEKLKTKSTSKQPKIKKRRKVSSEESEEDIPLMTQPEGFQDEDEQTSTEDETERSKVLIVGSSSSEDEDFL